MWKSPLCVVALACSGCYVSLGLGGGSSGATAHMTAGVAYSFGSHRAHVHAGGGGAVGAVGDRSVVASPLVVGGSSALIRSGKHALAAVVDVAPPFSGWVLESKTEPGETTRVGHAYLGVGYQYTLSRPDHAPDASSEPRPSGLVTLSVGPDVYWIRSDTAAVSVTADLTLMVDGWKLSQSLFDDD